MKILKITLLIFLFLFDYALSDTYEKIILKGNKRVSKETILDIANIKNNKLNLDDLNIIQKKIFNSGFFKDVEIKFDNKNLVIFLKENPIIDFFYIDGATAKENDFILDNLKLGPNKIFSENLLNQDLVLIRNFYKTRGYYNVDVKPILSELQNETLNLIIKLDKKNQIKIKRIFFTGEKIYKTSELLSVIESSEHGWWKFLSSTNNISETRIQIDKNRLKNYFLDSGYYDAQITSSEINLISNNFANITFSISAGNIYKISNIDFIDNSKNLNKKNFNDIKKISNKYLNNIYSKKNIFYLKDKIEDYLISNNIEFVSVSIGEKKEKNNININYIFSSEKKNFINLINVKGNSLTEESVVRNNLYFSEGDTISKHKIDKSIDKLKATRIFEKVNYKLDPVKDELVNLDITVAEQPTGSIGAGVGVSSSGSAISGMISEKNFLGKGIGLNMDLSLGTEKVSGTARTSLPYFNNTDNTLNNTFYAISKDFTNSGYESKILGNDTSITYQPYENIFFTPGVGINSDKVDTNSTASALLQSRDGSYTTFKTFYNVKSDKRNKRFNTTGGHVIGFGQDFGLPGSDIPYVKNNIFGTYYHQLSNEFILKFDSGVSSINSLNNKDVKLSDRLALNSKKLKGFESFGIGPKDGNDFVGGNYSAYSSLSSTIPNPFPENWNAKTSIFVNAGNVWGVDYDASKDVNKIRSATGVTMDWMSPIGPLSFTLAQPISKANTDATETFSFEIGTAF